MTTATTTKTQVYTIVLTNRPPVRVTDAAWPVIAQADIESHDGGEFKFQANRSTDRWMRVRQHKDGRTLVYGVHDYTTRYAGARSYEYQEGVLLLDSPDTAQIIDAIRKVGNDLGDRSGDDTWQEVLRELIADLPAEDL